jgi:riboflavin kinase
MFPVISPEMDSRDPYDYWALKTIKRIMGKNALISLSSRELGEMLGMSQQSASRIILKLIDEGFIQRKIEDRRQNISITDVGLDLLFSEMNDLATVLEMDNQLDIVGKVISGLGEGRYYISRKSYIIQFQEKLGFIPYLGTLNMKIEPENEGKLRRLRNSPGIHIDGFVTDDRTFGAVKTFMGNLNGLECAAILPERSVYSDVLEIISPFFLREKLKLSDGMKISLHVDL